MKRFLIFLSVCGIFLLLLLSLQARAVSSENSGVIFPLDHAVYLPVIFNRYDPQFPAPMFGVQVYGSTEQSSKYYPYIIGSQASWIRVSLSWENVEPDNRNPANYSWTQTDKMLSLAETNKGRTHIIAVVDNTPVWARLNANDSGGPIRQDALGDFGEFVEALVERYDGDGYEDAPGSPVVRHWEFYNEPDAGQNRWGHYGAEYAAMLQIAYPSVKRSDSGAQVLFGGIAYDWFESQGGPFVDSFLDDVLTAGAGAYFDIMNFHIYPLFEPNWGGGSTGLMGKTAVIRDKLAEYGLDKPIVITEAGWHNSPDVLPYSSDEEQIARLIQLYTHGLAADVKVMIWWMLWDPGSFFPDYGLVTDDSPPVLKQAYTAYHTAVNLLANTHATRQLTEAETGTTSMEAFQMTTHNGTVYTAWMNPYGATEVKPLQIPATTATILDGLGNTIGTAVDSNGDGYVTVTVSSQPIYVQITQ